MTGLPSSTLRYYESIGIVQPVGRAKTSKHRAYTQKDVDIIDAVACLNATGMKIDDMKAYIANASSAEVNTSEQVTLLKAQIARLDDEARHIAQRRKYAALKIEYWQAYERKDTKRVAEIAAQAQKLAVNLKKV